MTRQNLADALRLYLVADPDQCAGDFVTSVRQALGNGVTAVQLRAKSLSDREFVSLATRIRELTASHDVPLLLNDRIDIALVVGADGVHLGVHDIHPKDVRRITPTEFIIGYSPDTFDDDAGRTADYLGVGPVYGTGSKHDAGAKLGLDEFGRRVSSASAPVVGIGGIDASNTQPVLRAGAVGVAVVSAILGHPDPGGATRAIRTSIDHPDR